MRESARRGKFFDLLHLVLKVALIVGIAFVALTASSGSWQNFGASFAGAKGGMVGFMAALVRRSGPMTAGMT